MIDAEGLQVVGQAKDAMQDLRDMMDTCVNPTLSLNERIQMLNLDLLELYGWQLAKLLNELK